MEDATQVGLLPTFLLPEESSKLNFTCLNCINLVLIKPLNALSFLPKAIFLTLGWHIIDT